MVLSGSPKARVQAAYPKAVCKMTWGRGYRVDLNDNALDFNFRAIRTVQTGSSNPADAWEQAAFELRLDVRAA